MASGESAYRKVLADLRLRRQQLREDFARRYQDIVKAENVIAATIGEGPVEDDDPMSALLQLHGKPIPEAVAWALAKIREPAKVAEIADLLIRSGYVDESQRKQFQNSILIALRRKDKFTQQPDGSWALTEWEEGEPS